MIQYKSFHYFTHTVKECYWSVIINLAFLVFFMNWYTIRILLHKDNGQVGILRFKRVVIVLAT